VFYRFAGYKGLAFEVLFDEACELLDGMNPVFA
jgi:hypothetical protein